MQINLTVKWYHLLIEAVIGLALMGVFALGIARLADWWERAQAVELQTGKQAQFIQTTGQLLRQGRFGNEKLNHALEQMGYKMLAPPSGRVARAPKPQTSEEVVQ